MILHINILGCFIVLINNTGSWFMRNFFIECYSFAYWSILAGVGEFFYFANIMNWYMLQKNINANDVLTLEWIWCLECEYGFHFLHVMNINTYIYVICCMMFVTYRKNVLSGSIYEVCTKVSHFMRCSFDISMTDATFGLLFCIITRSWVHVTSYRVELCKAIYQ